MEQGMPRFLAILVAVAASFQIYLSLILGPVAISIFGRYFDVGFWPLWPSGELVFGDPKWFSAYGLAALLLQGGFAVLAYLTLRSPRMWRAIALGLSVPVVLFATPYLFLHALPLRLAVEADSAPEQRAWPLVCQVDGATLKTDTANTDMAFERSGRAWILRYDEEREFLGHGLLSMPGCIVAGRPLGVPPGNKWVEQYTASGAALIREWGDWDDNVPALYLAPAAENPVEIIVPEEAKYSSQVLSSDGRALAWVEDGGEGGKRVRFRHLDRSEMPLPGPRLDSGCSTQTLVGFDPGAGEFVIRQTDFEVAGLDPDGRILWGPVNFSQKLGGDARFRRLGDGWVAWDPGDRFKRVIMIRRARIEWDLPVGSGVHEVPAGRYIASLSVDPSGTLLAVSVVGSYWNSETPGAVYVLRTDAGSEIYRRYLPANRRADVAFLGPDYLAMDVAGEERRRIEVLRIAMKMAGS